MADSLNASQLDGTSYSPLRQLNYQDACLLVVEDNDDLWTFLNFALTKAFHDITIVRVRNAPDALTYINTCLVKQTSLPKLILQDLYMPQKQDGLGLLKELRSLLATQQQIPILVMSASTYPLDVEEVYQCQGSYYLVKPMEINAWLSLCQSIRQFWWDQGVLPINPYRQR